MKGLILAGGEGSRLGTEKALLNLRGQTQVSFMVSEFKKINIEPFVSVPEKKADLFDNFNLILDKSEIKGPLSGISAAFEFDPGPWIVFAVDMPFVDANVIQFILKHRDSEIATSFSLDCVNPEPLACIYEKKAGPMINEFVEQMNDSAFQFLNKHTAKMIKPEEERWILNINTPEDLQKVRLLLRSDSLN